MPHRTTKADLERLTRAVARESKALGILTPTDRLTLIPGNQKAGIPYRLHVNVTQAFEPADGNGGDVGRSAREVENTLRIMWATLRAARKVTQ